jgi:hypothetical protein
VHIDANLENNRAENLRWADHIALRVEGRKTLSICYRNSDPMSDVARVRAAIPDAGELRAVPDAPGIVVDDRGRIYTLRVAAVRESRSRLFQLDPGATRQTTRHIISTGEIAAKPTGEARVLVGARWARELSAYKERQRINSSGDKEESCSARTTVTSAGHRARAPLVMASFSEMYVEFSWLIFWLG